MKSRFVLVILATVAVGAFANGFDLLFRVAYLLLFGIGLSYAWAWAHVNWIKVETRRTADRAQVGAHFEEQITIYNTGRIPKLAIQIEETSDLPGFDQRLVGDFPPGGKRLWKPLVECRRRGRFQIGPVIVKGSDPFGIFELQKVFGESHPLIVYPKTYELPDFALSGPELPGEERMQQRTHYVTQNVSSIRDYVFGDSYNRIHWPSSARTGRIMVKEFEQEPGSNLWIVLDLQGSVQAGTEDESTEEYGVTIAASLAKKYLDVGRSVGLIAYGQQPELVLAEKGDYQLIRIFEALATVRATGHLPLSEVALLESRRFGRSTTLIVITPSTDEAWVQSLDYIGRKGIKSVVIYLDPVSFGRHTNTQTILARLLASFIPTYKVKKGQSIANVLNAHDDNDIMSLFQPPSLARALSR